MHRNTLLLAICYLGFISLGLPDALIGVAWPSVRGAFRLDQSDLAWIFVGSGCTYFASSFFSGRLLKSVSVGALLAASSALVALSCLDYALARVWTLFAAGSLLHGLGSGAIDAGLNSYAANHFSARHMNWLHASYSLGAMLGPLLMTGSIAWADSWRLGYGTVAVSILVLSLLFAWTKGQWNDKTPLPAGAKEEKPTEITLGQVFRLRLVWLQIALFFVYTGLEVAVGQWSFTVLTESRGIQPELAGLWVTLYWASILAGRIVFGFVIDRVSVDALVRWSTITALGGTALFAWNPLPLASPLALALTGLGLAVIFPCLMSRTPRRLGRPAAAHAVGLQVAAAMLGAAAIPSIIGFIAHSPGLHIVPWAFCAAGVVLLGLHETVLAGYSDPA